jgi:hypothetical protein
MTTREWTLMGLLATATALADLALLFAGLLAIAGRLLRARRAVVAPPRSRSTAA